MSLQERSATERVLEARARYVARGIPTPAIVVERAAGARIWDADGKEYLDFAGGIGCTNLGHCHDETIRAIHSQVDRYLHQCFMVGVYEPYVELCRRLAELSPCRGDEQKSILLNSGAEAVENAVKIARAATGRDAVVVFDNAFHGRTLLTMTMTSKTVYKVGGPFAPEVYRAPAPYPYRGVSTDDAIAGARAALQGRGGARSASPASCSSRCRARAASSRCRRTTRSGCASSATATGSSGSTTRCSRASAAPAPSGRSRTTTSSPTCSSRGKSLGGGLPLAAVTGRAEIVDAPGPGGLGGTFGGNPVACAAAIATLDALPSVRERAGEIGETVRARLQRLLETYPGIGEVRGLGPMLAIEFAEQTPDRANAVVAAARERGLVLLSCGLFGNVIRLHVPLVISDEDLERGLGILEESIGDTGRGAP